MSAYMNCTCGQILTNKKQFSDWPDYCCLLGAHVSMDDPGRPLFPGERRQQLRAQLQHFHAASHDIQSRKKRNHIQNKLGWIDPIFQGSLMANMILGMILLGKRYTPTKYLSVFMISIGIATCTIMSSHQSKANSATNQDDEKADDQRLDIFYTNSTRSGLQISPNICCSFKKLSAEWRTVNVKNVGKSSESWDLIKLVHLEKKVLERRGGWGLGVHAMDDRYLHADVRPLPVGEDGHLPGGHLRKTRETSQGGAVLLSKETTWFKKKRLRG